MNIGFVCDLNLPSMYYTCSSSNKSKIMAINRLENPPFKVSFSSFHRYFASCFTVRATLFPLCNHQFCASTEGNGRSYASLLLRWVTFRHTLHDAGFFRVFSHCSIKLLTLLLPVVVGLSAHVGLKVKVFPSLLFFFFGPDSRFICPI